MKRISRAVVFVCAVAIIAVVASVPPHAFSSTPVQTLGGYAWSSNIGWLCFYDATTPSNCTGASVNINSDNSLSGYAWSNEVGWISFNSGDTASCGSAATYNPSTGALSGWAKALDGVDSDGCISLSGTAQNSSSYGVTFTNGQASGYAWGSDVLGWVSFWGSNYGVTAACPNGLNYGTYGPSCTCPANYTQNGSTCVANATSISSGTFTVNPTRLPPNTPRPVTFSYQVTNPPAGGCTITGTGGFTTIPLTQAQVISGSYTTSETIAQSTSLTLTCGTATATAALEIIPVYQEI